MAAAEYALYLGLPRNYAWQGRDTALAKRPRRDAFADNPSYEAVVKMVRLAGLAAHKDAKSLRLRAIAGASTMIWQDLPSQPRAGRQRHPPTRLQARRNAWLD